MGWIHIYPGFFLKNMSFIMFSLLLFLAVYSGCNSKKLMRIICKTISSVASEKLPKKQNQKKKGYRPCLENIILLLSLAIFLQGILLSVSLFKLNLLWIVIIKIKASNTSYIWINGSCCFGTHFWNIQSCFVSITDAKSSCPSHGNAMVWILQNSP